MRLALALSALPMIAAADMRFEDRADAVPIAHIYAGNWTHFVGGGVAVFDCNGDDWPDFYAAGGANPSRLFVNAATPEVLFTNSHVPELSAVTGAYPIDIDSDGHVDLAVLRNGRNVLLRGDGACGFTDANEAWGFDGGDRWSTAFSATWEADQTFPTLAIGNYVDQSNPDGPFGACDVNTLHRPDGAGYGAPDILSPGYCALSILFSDWTRSGTPELRVSNDRHYYLRGGYEQMWQLDPLRERGAEDGWEEMSIWGMGIASADLFLDGYPEVMLTSMGDQVLVINDAGTLRRAPFETGTTLHRPHTGGDGRPSTGWHAAFEDVDNNGLLDLFVTKGNVDQMPGMAMQDPNNLLLQLERGRFEEVAETAGIATLHRSRGAAVADFNRDGALDLVVVNRRAPLELWINAGEAGNWVTVAPRQTGPNRDAIGAVLEIETQDGVERRERTIGGGHVSGTLLPMHLGLGAAESVTLRVIWPDGTASAWQTIPAGTRAMIVRN